MIAAAVLGIAAGAGQAAAPRPHWVRVGVAAGGGPIEIDRSSLNWHSLQRARWRVLHPQPQPDGTVEERHIEMIDCASRTSSGLQTTLFGPGGHLIDDQRDPYEVTMRRMAPPTPDTTGETVTVNACRLRPPPPPKRKAQHG
jgi:hypothetical protein